MELSVRFTLLNNVIVGLFAPVITGAKSFVFCATVSFFRDVNE